MENKKLNLYEKILDIKQEVKIMRKNADGNKFKYVDESSLLSAIETKMTEHKLLLIPNILNGTTNINTVEVIRNSGKTAKESLINADMKFTWIDAETKEKLDVEWELAGQQENLSQSFGSGLTYANRYFLLKFFNVETTNDDPDAILKQREEEEKRKKMSATQTKIKKLYSKLLKIYPQRDKLAQAFGYADYAEFNSIFQDPERNDKLLEQLETYAKENNIK